MNILFKPLLGIAVVNTLWYSSGSEDDIGQSVRTSLNAVSLAQGEKKTESCGRSSNAEHREKAPFELLPLGTTARCQNGRRSKHLKVQRW